jgi:hypothetical protein
MGFFTPMDCSVGDSTQHWLLAGIAALTLMVILSLAELLAQWRRARRADVSWLTWLLLVPTLLWSLVCGLLAIEAIGRYRDEAAYLTSSPQQAGGPPESPFGLCFAIAQTGAYIQFALAVGAVLLAIGGASLLSARRRATTLA